LHQKAPGGGLYIITPTDDQLKATLQFQADSLGTTPDKIRQEDMRDILMQFIILSDSADFMGSKPSEAMTAHGNKVYLDWEGETPKVWYDEEKTNGYKMGPVSTGCHCLLATPTEVTAMA